MRFERYLEVAKTQSLNSIHHQRVGAVVVNKSAILATGYNQVRHLKVGKRYTNFECSLHAERDACRKLDKSLLKGATIVVYRQLKNGTPAEAFPCDQCLWMLQELGVRRVISSCGEYPYYRVTKI